MNKYKLGICGGTFDFFHAGHKDFLKKVLEKSKKVILGITSDLYINSFKGKEGIESFAARKKSVEEFLKSSGSKDRVRIIPIDNPFEPLLTDSVNPKVIFVTAQTKNTAEEINQKRKDIKLPELEIIVLPMVLAEDGGIISSSRIRNGEINRKGKLYLNPKWKNKKLMLPANVRSILQQPFGEVLNKIPKGLDGSKVITIGDITTQKFNRNNSNQFLSIVDFLVKRKKKFSSLSELGFTGSEETLKTKNPPGTVTSELFELIRKVFQTKDKKAKVILVEGEEDLAVLPVVLAAPLGFSIFYGQPGQGLVRVNVNEENKERVYKLVKSFISRA